MASSLLFKIQSIFDNTGFREAQAGFTSTLGAIGKLAAGAAKLAILPKVLGGIGAAMLAWDIAKAGVGVLKFMYESVPATAGAEAAFSRLEGQLELLGKGSKENLGLVTAFAERTAQKTRFSLTETEEATTAALRRTRDLGTALKEVSVAQDIAAKLQISLADATDLLNRAQAGQTRGLLAITNLRQADIQAAVRQGTVLDLVGAQFKGAAAKDAQTYAGLMVQITNRRRELREEFGKPFLPLAEALKQLDLNLLNAQLIAVKAIVDPKSLIKYFQDAKRLQKELRPGPAFTFNYSKELEQENARMGKTFEERRQMIREEARIEDILRIAESSGTDVLTKEQISLIQTTQWGTQQLNTILSNQATEVGKKRKQIFDAEKQRMSDYEDRQGKFHDVISKGWDKDHNPLLSITGVPNKSALESTLANVSKRIENFVKADIKPLMNIKIGWDVTPETITTAVKNAIIQQLPGLMANLIRAQGTTSQKENKAASPLV